MDAYHTCVGVTGMLRVVRIAIAMLRVRGESMIWVRSESMLRV